jgi:ligand-binding sensor domain-containing protein
MAEIRESLPQSARLGCLIVFCWFQLSSACIARALNPEVQITQYVHTAWRIQDGTISTKPSALEQTVDGHMWVATHDGLMRFDGVRFRT